MEPPKDQEKIVETFKQGPGILKKALSGLSDSDLDYAPSNGGWSIREIVHHLADGDDIWKIGIKAALGNEQSEYSFPWYFTLTQTEWAKRWNYNKRSIETSLAFLKAARDQMMQLLETADDGWSKSIQFRKKDGGIELVPVGAMFEMQANHIVHHAKRISEIREEISGK